MRTGENHGNSTLKNSPIKGKNLEKENAHVQGIRSFGTAREERRFQL